MDMTIEDLEIIVHGAPLNWVLRAQSFDWLLNLYYHVKNINLTVRPKNFIAILNDKIVPFLPMLTKPR